MSMRPGCDYTSADFPHSPLLVFWELTRACDLVCQHCRACAHPMRHPNELNTDQSLALIDSLLEFQKKPMLILTGGDPLKRDDLTVLIKRGVDRGLRVALTPSATPLLTHDALDRLKEIGLSAIALSVDGADARTHDAFRGVPGSFARTIDAIEYATRIGFHVQINTTVSCDNFGQIDAMAESLGRFSIATWSVFFLVPVGRGLMQKRLSAMDYEKAFATLLRQTRLQKYRIKTTEAPHYRRFVSQHVPEEVARGVLMAPTNDGRGVMFVSHTGDIYPSGFLPKCCGRFPKNSIVATYQNSPLFVRLRDTNQLKGKCGACPYKMVCGGSRARAYALTRDPLAAEPDCCFIPPGCENDSSCEQHPRSLLVNVRRN